MELKQVTLNIPKGYKNTEVGVIPEDWEVKQLGDVLKIRHGRSQKEVEVLNGKYPILGTGGEMGTTNTFLYNKPSVLIGRKGTIDKPRYMETPFWTVDTLFYSEVFPDALPKYLYYNFLLIDWYSHNEASGVPSLNASKIEKIKIPFPPLPEQTAIATVLSDTDSLIQALEKKIAKKQLIKKGAMQELLKPKEGWERFLMPKVCWFQEGPGVRNYQFTTSGVKLLNGTNIEKGNLLLEKTDRYISNEEAFGWYSHFLVDDGDILIACSGVSIEKFHEKVTFAESKHLPLCMNTSTMRFKIISEKLEKDFLFHFLKSDSFKDQIGGKATGSAQLNFGPSHVSMVSISLPLKQEQVNIAQILSDMDTEIELLQEKLSKYKQLKQGLMQELLTGRIRLV